MIKLYLLIFILFFTGCLENNITPISEKRQKDIGLYLSNSDKKYVLSSAISNSPNQYNISRFVTQDNLKKYILDNYNITDIYDDNTIFNTMDKIFSDMNQSTLLENYKYERIAIILSSKELSLEKIVNTYKLEIFFISIIIIILFFFIMKYIYEKYFKLRKIRKKLEKEYLLSKEATESYLSKEQEIENILDSLDDNNTIQNKINHKNKELDNVSKKVITKKVELEDIDTKIKKTIDLEWIKFNLETSKLKEINNKELETNWKIFNEKQKKFDQVKGIYGKIAKRAINAFSLFDRNFLEDDITEIKKHLDYFISKWEQLKI